MLEAPPPQEVLMKDAQGALAEPDWPLREGTTERTWPLQEVLLEGAPTTLEARGTCQPKKKPPWKAIPKLRRPFGAGKMSAVGTVACLARRHLAVRKFKSVRWPHQQKNWPNTFTHVCTTFPLSRTTISRASYRVLRPSTRGQGGGQQQHHMSRPSRPVTHAVTHIHIPVHWPHLIKIVE